MNTTLSKHMAALKAALLDLTATGEDGFEGLIAATLREICGVPFRLAKSGLQFGVDGKATFETDAVGFEGKRYDGSVARSDILSKFGELLIADAGIDIWVLGATSQIGTQVADAVREAGRQLGIATIILDWSDTDLPPFAVALAMGKNRVEGFLTTHVSNTTKLGKALAAIKAVKSHVDCAVLEQRIRNELSDSTLGGAITQKANATWLKGVFCDCKLARRWFGQPLSPGATSNASVRLRSSWVDKLHPYFATGTDARVVCVLGGEGNGKSWLVAQAWLELPKQPLTIFLGTDAFPEGSGFSDPSDALIDALQRQTGADPTTVGTARWKRRLARWRQQPTSSEPRLVVVIDGLNQRSTVDWARVIDGVADELRAVGGRLFVTSRTAYFKDRIKPRLTADVIEVVVPEWTEPERDEILASHAIRAAELRVPVARALRNPRLLGIALELLTKADIADLRELTVWRLLFEHIRTSERDAAVQQPSAQFARKLQEDARILLDRVRAKQEDDLKVFESAFQAVVDGRFYEELEGDRTRYMLKDDGLTLALGFAVIDVLRIAERNGRDLRVALEQILEPISALDDTAKVVLAALTIGVIDTSLASAAVTTLVSGFAILQNTDQTDVPALASLARRRPLAFMAAARTLALAKRRHPSFDWIQLAMITASRNSAAWQDITDEIRQWLAAYSLSPERRMFSIPGRDPELKVKEEREKNDARIKQKLAKLSSSEQEILAQCHPMDGDISNLCLMAFHLLAGKSLAPFADALVKWAFSNSLNPDFNAPDKQFAHLIGLNSIDWIHARTALLDALDPLRSQGTSPTGLWAVVGILRATGDENDDLVQQKLTFELTKDREILSGWRSVEGYSASDPCDPSSQLPDNFMNTEQAYAQIDVHQIRIVMGVTGEDHLLAEARPAMVRFGLDTAVAKHLEFAEDVLIRNGFPLRQGLLELREHNALVSSELANKLIARRVAIRNAPRASGLTEKDAWIISQYFLLVAFPFLTSGEQAEALLPDEHGDPALLELFTSSRPLDEAAFEKLLVIAISTDKAHNLSHLFEFYDFSGRPLSPYVSTTISTLFHSTSRFARADALGFIARARDADLLKEVALSDWTAAGLEADDGFEAWFGSLCLLEAASQALISHEAIVARISPELYGRAALHLAPSAVRRILKRIDTSIRCATSIENDLIGPDIVLRIDDDRSFSPDRFSICDPPVEPNNIEEQMNRFSESSEAFERRQHSNQKAFRNFAAAIRSKGARVALDSFTIEEFERALEHNEDFADRWYLMFMALPEAKLRMVHNLARLLAYVMGSRRPADAKALFDRTTHSEPIVRIIFNDAEISLDLITVWSGVRDATLDALRFERLDIAANNDELAREVLAASLCGQHALLAAYVESKLAMTEPSDVARGLMVAGFSDKSDASDSALARFKGHYGMIGQAQKTARYAYERNEWARHWFEQMCIAKTPVDFWRYQTLLLRIVDGRFDLWASRFSVVTKPMQDFGPSIRSRLRNRVMDWAKKRKDQLFGSSAPERIFLGLTST